MSTHLWLVCASSAAKRPILLRISNRGIVWLSSIALAAVILYLPQRAVARDIRAAEINTEHLFGFLNGTDVGKVGEKELESETTGHFGKGTGSYTALLHHLALELMPLPNFRLDLGASNSYH